MLEKVFNQKAWSVDPFDEDAKNHIVSEFNRYMILSEVECEELYKSIATLDLAATITGQAPARYSTGLYEFIIAYADQYFLEGEYESDFADAMIQVSVKYKHA